MTSQDLAAPPTPLAQAQQLLAAGRTADAANLLRAALAKAPQDGAIAYVLATILQSLGQHQAAIEAYGRTINLAAMSAHERAQAANNQGVCYESLGDIVAAERAYQTATTLDPTLAQAHYNHARALQAQGKHDDAIAPLETALTLEPRNIAAWLNLHGALSETRRNDKALAAFVKIDTAFPTPAAPLLSAGLALARRCDEAMEQRYMTAVVQWANHAGTSEDGTKSREAIASELLAPAQYFDFTASEIKQLYDQFNDATRARQTSRTAPLPRRTAGARTRIGYLSPDFRKHVMGTLLLPVLEAHDRARYELTLISSVAPSPTDAITQAFHATADRFISIAQMDDATAAQTIAQLDLDLLIDLAGHTEGGRPMVYAYKPARVIATHLGYHGCLGLATVDYKVTDRYCDTEESVRYQLEAPLALDTCVFPLRRVESAILPEDARDKAQLTGKLVVAAFVNVLKLSPRLMRVWRQFADAVPNAVFAVSPTYVEDETALRAAFARAGIDADRVRTIPRQPNEPLQRARYQLVDLVLDTFPYSGGDTTLAALDAGVPVVALAGRRHAERTSASILTHLGLHDWVTQSEGEYLALAVKLATDRDHRGLAVAKLREALKATPLANPREYAASLERAWDQALCEKGVDHLPVASLTAEAFFAQMAAAVAAHQNGRTTEAQRLYIALLADQPGYAPVSHLLGRLLLEKGDMDDARAAFQAALAHTEGYSASHLELANIALDAGEWSNAAEHYDHVVTAQPDRVAAFTGAALAYSKLGQHQIALERLMAANALAPHDATVLFNLGNTLQKLGRFDAARTAYRQAVTIDPRHKEALYNYAVLLREQGQAELAIKGLYRVLAIDPKFEDAYLQLRPTLLAAGHIPQWLDNLDKYERNIPNAVRANLYSIEAAIYLGQAENARKHLDRAIVATLVEPDVDIAMEMLEELLYLVLFFDIAPEDHLRLYRRFDALSAEKYPPLPSPSPRAHDRKIRLGYLSADLRHHVMGKMVYQALAHHDRQKFEVFAYSLSAHEDALTQTIADSCDSFVRLAGMAPFAAAKRIRADDIDILIDCSTHTKGSEPGIVIHRPARCQVTYIASSGCLGSQRVDFKLTDEHLDLADQQRFQLEPALTMQRCVFPYTPVAPLSPSPYTRKLLRLPASAFVFGAFVQILKLSPRLLAVWKRILDRLPNAMLAFSPGNMSARQGYVNLCAANGIAPARLVFLDAGKTEAENMARFNVIDAVLDTFPYGGVNGTLEAVAAAVPMVSLTGRRNQERTSTSIFRYLGVTDTLAHSETQYVEIACKLALDAGFRKAVREKLRTTAPSSSLADAVGYTRAFEAALVKGLRECESVRRATE